MDEYKLLEADYKVSILVSSKALVGENKVGIGSVVMPGAIIQTNVMIRIDTFILAGAGVLGMNKVPEKSKLIMGIYMWRNSEMKYLMVVAHPDDEVLGAGATVRKLVDEGNEIAVAIMVGQAGARVNLSITLADDEKKALEIMGVQKVYTADFPNIKMNTIPHLELVQFIEKAIEDFGAKAIITHHPADTNIDHVETSRAVQAAFRLFQRRKNLPALNLLLYMEVLSSTEWALDTSANRFMPNYFVEVGKEGIENKIKALKCYKGVMRSYPHPRSDEAIRGLAAYRGAQAGCNYAEAFECAYLRK